LSDEQGRTVGVLLAKEAFQKLTAENECLKAEVARLQAVTAEREQTIQSLYATLEAVAGFRPEQLADLEKKGASLDGVIAEFERDLRSQEQSDKTQEPDEPTIILDKKRI
jgi:hypothetical protein